MSVSGWLSLAGRWPSAREFALEGDGLAWGEFAVESLQLNAGFDPDGTVEIQATSLDGMDRHIDALNMVLDASPALRTVVVDVQRDDASARVLLDGRLDPGPDGPMPGADSRWPQGFPPADYPST